MFDSIKISRVDKLSSLQPELEATRQENVRIKADFNRLSAEHDELVRIKALKEAQDQELAGLREQLVSKELQCIEFESNLRKVNNKYEEVMLLIKVYILLLDG